MTKGLVSCALGLLVNEGNLSWDTPVRELLPDYAPRNQWLRESATIADFLCMRSSLEQYNVWTQSDNRINFNKSDTFKIINSLCMGSDLRYGWTCNNWSYEVAAAVCRSVSGETWDSLRRSRFFEPLRLGRTEARGNRNALKNVSKSYMVLDNGCPVSVPVTPQSGSTAFGAAGGVVSCVDDLMSLCRSILTASIHQISTNTTSTSNNSFKQLSTIMSAHQVLPGSALRESTYGFGWIRTELPNQMCKIGPNYSSLGDAPTIGEGAPSKLVIAHYGSMPGSYSGVLFPDTESIIVVVTNTTPRCDFSDYATQLLTDLLFDLPVKYNYADWVQRTVDKEREWHRRLSRELEEKQRAN